MPLLSVADLSDNVPTAYNKTDDSLYNNSGTYITVCIAIRTLYLGNS